MNIQPYLFFEGRLEEALQFYRKIIDIEVLMMMRYSESPDAPPPDKIPPGSENKIMHATLRFGDNTIMASDGFCSGKTNFQGFSLSLSLKSEADAERVFNALADGGQVNMPMGKTFFSSRFGMLVDRFGLGWMVIVETEQQTQ